ncbi:MAG: non-hydrolyzing UDP-N-acetylglucosamine 2-epimerase [Promethearchaeota archaeon]
MSLRPFIVVGTRPEIIKMAPVVHECESRGIDTYLLHTGQHYSKLMSNSIFSDMGLREPDKNLDIGSGTHGEQTAKALVGIEKEILREEPDVVVVQGDTNASLSTAVAAVKLRVPLAHIEAGLRSYDHRMPEEHNRRLTDHAADFLFAPTENSARILKNENVRGKVFVTGNTVIDALESRLPVALERPNPASRLGVSDFALLTLHRSENVDDIQVLRGLIKGVISLNKEVLFTAHPRTVKRLQDFDLMREIESSRMRIIDPVGYLDFLHLLHSCDFTVTDSGGIQEEVTAPSINKRVFVLRISTERPEAVESGHATVVGVDPAEFPQTILEEVKKGLQGERPCPYGQGTASKMIVDALLEEV